MADATPPTTNSPYDDGSPDGVRPSQGAAQYSDLWLGKLLGKYRITGRLGRGGMGIVYQADDTQLKRSVAIKLILPAIAADQAVLKRFLREAQTAAQLNHPNTVAVHDIAQYQGTHYLVMEMVQGPSGQILVAKQGPLPWRVATQIIADACRGLAAAHEAKLIHRDIKPANILLSRNGEAKLSDFGLAKIVEDSDNPITASGHFLGTPQYMSPEQAKSDDLDERTDIYSLGATYYALLTGKPPYQGKNPHAILLALCSRPSPNPRIEAPDLPDSCLTILEKSMARRRVDRYGSAIEMLRDLEAALGHEREPLSELARKHEPKIEKVPNSDLPHVLEPTPSTIPIPNSERRSPSRWLWPAVGLALLAIVAATSVVAWKFKWGTDDPAQLEDAQVLYNRVVEKLQKLNPAHKNAPEMLVDPFSKRIVQWKMRLKNVTDIAPLAELRDLQILELLGTNERGWDMAEFKDIFPLKKLQSLKQLIVINCKVEDLRAIHDHALEHLDVMETQVHDLSPLQAMRSLKYLRVSGSKTTSLEALRNLDLDEFHVSSTKVRDLEPIAKSNIRVITLYSDDLIDDAQLVHLARMKSLEELDLSATGVTRIDPLVALPRLRVLNLRSTRVRDFEPLARMSSLKQLSGPFTPEQAKDWEKKLGPGVHVAH